MASARKPVSRVYVQAPTGEQFSVAPVYEDHAATKGEALPDCTEEQHTNLARRFLAAWPGLTGHPGFEEMLRLRLRRKIAKLSRYAETKCGVRVADLARQALKNRIESTP
jgi:hypothetical protein